MARVEDSSPRPTNMTDTLEHLIQQTLGEDPFRLDTQQNQTIFSRKGEAQLCKYGLEVHFFICFLCLCSCTTCCRTDFRFCQQDPRQHRTRGSHGRTGRPAGPDIQNLEKEATSTEKSGEKRHYHHHVLSCCNYAPLCMPFNPEYTHIVCHTSTHTTSCVCMYVCLFQPCTCTTHILASVLCVL